MNLENQDIDDDDEDDEDFSGKQRQILFYNCNSQQSSKRCEKEAINKHVYKKTLSFQSRIYK